MVRSCFVFPPIFDFPLSSRIKSPRTQCRWTRQRCIYFKQLLITKCSLKYTKREFSAQEYLSRGTKKNFSSFNKYISCNFVIKMTEGNDVENGNVALHPMGNKIIFHIKDLLT